MNEFDNAHCSPDCFQENQFPSVVLFPVITLQQWTGQAWNFVVKTYFLFCSVSVYVCLHVGSLRHIFTTEEHAVLFNSL